MRRVLALFVVGALVLGVLYYWKYQPGRLPHLRADKLGEVGTKLGEVKETVGEKLRATKTKGGVKAALELNRNLNSQPIEVDASDDGSVVLRGSVPSEEVRAEAGRVAAGVPDVARVDNQLRVDPALAASSGEGRSFGENFDDHALEAKVKLAYSLSKDMKGADVKVSAFRREVTLGGTVLSEAQRQAALQIAQQTPQVSAVKDGLAVAGGASGSAPASASSASAPPRAGAVADPARAAQTALATNPNLAGFVLKAQMVGGRLVLTGRVRTGAEKDLAGVVARDAASAAVENNVIVQP
ncbi:MAG TPA: BON domain-containing protein [Vicinamibacteria bacterium]|nr:BON domain-containing protein [Vicinamibacteria bacterium]